MSDEPISGEDELTGFATVAVITVLTSVVYFTVFAYVRLPYRKFIFASNPDGPIATAPSMSAWFAAVCSLGPNDAYKIAGIDGWVHTARALMHLKVGALLAVASLPLALCYSYSGPTAAGFNRISFTNVLVATEKTKKVWSWVTVLVAWITHLVFLTELDKLDQKANHEIYRDAMKPRADHFALIVMELEGSTKEELVENARMAVTRTLGREDAVLHIELVPKYSTDVVPPLRDAADAAESGKSMVGGAGAKLAKLAMADGLRQRVGKYESTMAAVACADAAYVKWQAAGENESVTKGCCASSPVKMETAEEKMKRCRTEANEARDKVLEGVRQENSTIDYSRAAFVLVDKLSSACVAIRVDKIAPPWITAAPEPRDVQWSQLECATTCEVKRHKESVGFLVKSFIFIFWAALLATVLIGVKIILGVASKAGGPVATLCALLGPIINASLASFLLNFMAVIIAGTFAPKFDSVFTKSRTEYIVQRDYTVFLLCVGFATNLLAGSLFDALSEVSGSPFSIFGLLAEAVPSSATFFINFIFFRISTMVSAGSQVARWGTFYALGKIFPPVNDFAAAKAYVPPLPKLAFEASWENFVLVCLLTYTPIAPATAWVCILYFVVADFFSRQDLCAISKPNFSAAGEFWPLYTNQALNCQSIALLVHVAIFLLSENWWIFLAILPVVAYSYVVNGRIKRRRGCSLHGPELRGRITVADAYPMDSARANVTAHNLATGAQRDMHWAAPFGPKPADPDLIALEPLNVDDVETMLTEDENAMPRQIAIDAWLKRYEDASFTHLGGPTSTEDDVESSNSPGYQPVASN